MADRYDRTIKVNQSTIDEIKKLGMSEAIKKANSGGASREFVEGAKRFYGGNKVSGTTTGGNESKRGVRGQGGGPSTTSSPSPSPTESPKTQPISSNKPNPPSQAAVGRKLENKPPPGLSRANVKQIEKVTKPVAKHLKTQSDIGKASRSHAADWWGDVGKNIGDKLGLNNPFKPRKRK